jgi:hypothetical protein
MLTQKQGLSLRAGIGLGAALMFGSQPVAAQGEAQARLLELDGVVGQVEIRTAPGGGFQRSSDARCQIIGYNGAGWDNFTCQRSNPTQYAHELQ